MAYQSTTEVASTHTIARLTMNRMLAMIRMGDEFGPFPVNEPVRGRSGQLHPRPVATGDEPFPAQGNLHRDEGPLAPHHREERAVETLGRLAQDTGPDLDAVCAQVRQSPALDQRVRIFDRYDRAADAGRHDLRRAGAAPPRRPVR